MSLRKSGQVNSGLREKVLQTLDMNPMHIGKLASELNMSEPRSVYLDLLNEVSDMEAPTNVNSYPELKHASAVRLDKGVVYPIYRTDQEESLIKDGRLAEEETEIDLQRVAEASGINLASYFSFLKQKR